MGSCGVHVFFCFPFCLTSSSILSAVCTLSLSSSGMSLVYWVILNDESVELKESDRMNDKVNVQCLQEK